MSGVAATLRPYVASDFAAVLAVVNDAAEAYRGVIPDDCWHDPYMSRDALAAEIADGVAFTLIERAGGVCAVMGLQDRGAVALLRHANVRRDAQRAGHGRRLLRHVRAAAGKPLLVGTWAAARWAIEFYLAHGFHRLDAQRAATLLRCYWHVPQRQIETSVVLADTAVD